MTMWTQPAFWLMLLPLVAAATLWPAGRWPRAQAAAGVLLAWLSAAWLWWVDLPAAGAMWPVFGRAFVLTPALQTLFVYLLLGAGLLSLLSLLPFLNSGPRFVPVMLALLSPAAAMVMIRPFLLAAPFWLLLVVGTLSLFRYEKQSGVTAVQTAFRYWLLLLLATLLLLLAGWMLGGTQAALLLPGARLLALALGIMLAGFPFFIWVRPVVTAVPLLALPVLVGLLPLVAAAFYVTLLPAYPALAQTDAFLVWLPWSAGLTVLLAGFLALAATDWRDLLGSLILLDMGFALLALPLAGWGGWETAVGPHLLRLVSLLLLVIGSYAVGGQSLSLFDNRYALFREQNLLKGAGWLWTYGLLSLLGLPLTPGFYGRWPLLATLGSSEIASLPLALLLVGGLALALLGIGRQVWTNP